MRELNFYIVLLVLNAVIVTGLYQMRASAYGEYLDLSFYALFVLNVFNVLMFYRARYLSSHSDDKRYMRLIFANFILKLLLIIGMPVVYVLLTRPEENHFIIPFIIIYLVFTIFETWFLNRSAIMRKG